MEDINAAVRRTFIITIDAFFLLLLVIFITIPPIGVKGIFPLLDPASTNRWGGPTFPYEVDVFLAVDRHGRIYVDESPATPAQLAAAFDRAATSVVNWRGEPEHRRVFVRVDKHAPFGAVRTIVRAAQERGHARLIFLARPDGSGSMRLDSMWY